MPNANMTVIQVDGGHRVVDAPGANSVGVLYPGERIDVIAEKTDLIPEKHSNFTISLDRE